MKPRSIIYRSLLALMLLAALEHVPRALADDLEDLDGAAILHAGGFSEEECPSGDRYDCSSWPQFFMRADSADLCFSLQLPICAVMCQGMLVVDRTEQIRFVAFDGVGANPQSTSVTMYHCPD